MSRRLRRAVEPLTPLGRYAVPAPLLVWAVTGAWGTEEAGAKILVAALATGVLTRAAEWPIVALAAAFAGLFLVGSLPVPGPEDPLLVGVMYASYCVGRHATLRHQPWAAAGVLLLLSSNLTEPGRDVVAADVVFPVILTAAPWLLGLTVQLAKHREREAVRYAGELDSSVAEEVRRAATEERLRIAQEFHDVVAHDISGLSLQAQVLRRRAEAGGAVRTDELRDLERTAQQAMNDLRRLLGVLRPPDGDSPLTPGEGLDELSALVDRSRRLGQRIELDVSGTPRVLPPALSMTAFRILQEAITNARRHGGRGVTSVRLDWTDTELRLRVANPMTEANGSIPGHGVTGMRERTHVLGGQARVGPDGGSWIVEVTLPTPAVARTSP